MKLLLAAVGRIKAGPERDLFEEYRRRLTWPLDLVEVEEKRALPTEQRRTREAALLLEVIERKAGTGAIMVALDERGRQLASADFAARFGQWRDRGAGTVAFLVGGADGHGSAVTERADFMLSLGAMTWPHLLVRAMLAEQLYRAQQILAGHPYHRA